MRVSIVVFPECDPSIVYGIFDTLWAAGHLWCTAKGLPPRAPLFEPRLVAAGPGPLRLCTGVSILPQDTIDEVADTDLVFVPNVMIGSPGELDALDRRMLAWITRMHAEGVPLYAACGGSLVLAEAGLLDGHAATTHWSYVPIFRRRFPNVTLHEDRVLVQTGADQRIVCAGGASSWQDLALLLIAKRAGAEEAIRTSKLFLFQWHREGQLPYASMIANPDHGDAVIARCQSWIADNYHRADIVAAVVAHAQLAKRTFDRRFAAATGYSPLAYVQALRIEEAKHMLERGTDSVETIAREVGYEDIASFRRLFRRLAGMTPGAYRRKFNVPHFARELSGNTVRPSSPRAAASSSGELARGAAASSTIARRAHVGS